MNDSSREQTTQAILSKKGLIAQKRLQPELATLFFILSGYYYRDRSGISYCETYILSLMIRELFELFPKAYPIGLQQIIRRFPEQSNLYLVGGSVRNTLMGTPLGDLDLASTLSPEEIKDLFQSEPFSVVPTGLKHQTVTIVLKQAKPEPNLHFEITTLRGEGIRPEGKISVSTSIEQDLKYRDFTVNSFAYDLKSKELIYSAESKKDLENSVLRCVGNASERFQEDPLRILRLVRFAVTLGFKPAIETLSGARKLSVLLSDVAVERVREEFSKLLLSPEPRIGLLMLQYLGVLKIFLPEFDRAFGYEQNMFHKADLFEHTLEVTQNVPAELRIRLAALFHDISKPDTLSVDEQGDRHFYKHEVIGADLTREILKRLKYPKQLSEEVVSLVATHMRPLTCGKSGLRRLIRDVSETYQDWRTLKEADSLACKVDSEQILSELEDFDQRIEEVKSEAETHPFSHLEFDGNDAIALGLAPSPKIGELLNYLAEEVLENPELNSKESLEKLAKNYLDNS